MDVLATGFSKSGKVRVNVRTSDGLTGWVSKQDKDGTSLLTLLDEAPSAPEEGRQGAAFFVRWAPEGGGVTEGEGERQGRCWLHRGARSVSDQDAGFQELAAPVAAGEGAENRRGLALALKAGDELLLTLAPVAVGMEGLDESVAPPRELSFSKNGGPVLGALKLPSALKLPALRFACQLPGAEGGAKADSLQVVAAACTHALPVADATAVKRAGVLREIADGEANYLLVLAELLAKTLTPMWEEGKVLDPAWKALQTARPAAKQSILVFAARTHSTLTVQNRATRWGS